MAAFEQKLNAQLLEFYALVDELVIIRRQSPRLKAQTAKMLEGYMIDMSRHMKAVSKENGDDLTAGISWMKIKLMG